MDEAEQLCDRLVVMDGGVISAEGSPAELIERHSTKEVVELRFAPDAPRPSAGELDRVAERVEELPDRLLLYASDGEAALEAVHASGVRPQSSLVRRSSLEDVFLRLTGRRLVE
jgi:lipooligosaccharide transport system ATP-binding protein